MKPLLLTTLVLATAFTAACQGPRTTKETVIQRDIPAPSTGGVDLGGAQMGGVDGGGGASYRGRPIDSYRIEFFSRTEEAAGVMSAIERMATVNRMFAAVMMHIVRERSWMMIPGDLDKIPSLKMGIHVETDQVAIHKMREVWINSKLFDEMNLADRQTLLVHEVVMGVRFLEFSNEMDRCIARAAIHLLEKQTDEVYSVERKKCVNAERHRLTLGAGSNLAGSVHLTDVDNAMIRKLTSQLVNPSDELPDEDELDLWLVRSKVITPQVAKEGDAKPADASQP